LATRKPKAIDGAFAFDRDEALEHLRASDAGMARLIETVGPFGMQLKHASSVFEVLLEAIVYQQLSGKAAATIHSRVCALIPRTRGALAAARLIDVPDEKLRGAGLSRAKLLAVRDLALAVADRRIPTLAQAQRMDDDALIERLIEVRGVGRWTAQMFLIFSLGRPDVFPPDDLGIKMALRNLYGLPDLPTKSEAHALAASWTPHSTFATWYLWRSLDLAKAAK